MTKTLEAKTNMNLTIVLALSAIIQVIVSVVDTQWTVASFSAGLLVIVLAVAMAVIAGFSITSYYVSVR